MYSKYLILFALVGYWACQPFSSEENHYSDCKYGKPSAIFDSTFTSIEFHQFEEKEMVALEKVVFSDGTQLELIQSGCNQIKQEFQFTLVEKPSADRPDYWVAQTRQQFLHMGEMGESLLSFNFWAQALEAQADQINLGESFELQPGYFIKIDRIIGNQKTLLLITLSSG